jgi:hypothetical protein
LSWAVWMPTLLQHVDLSANSRRLLPPQWIISLWCHQPGITTLFKHK